MIERAHIGKQSPPVISSRQAGFRNPMGIRMWTKIPSRPCRSGPAQAHRPAPRPGTCRSSPASSLVDDTWNHRVARRSRRLLTGRQTGPSGSRQGDAGKRFRSLPAQIERCRRSRGIRMAGERNSRICDPRARHGQVGRQACGDEHGRQPSRHRGRGDHCLIRRPPAGAVDRQHTRREVGPRRPLNFL